MKIAIIGAGLSGAVLANKLKSDGLNVTVIEKSRGRGGRMFTKRLAWHNCDMGAQYFTARDPLATQLVDDWVRQGIVAQWDFQPSKLKAGVLLPSVDYERRYVAQPEMNSLAKHLLQDVKLQLNSRVVRATTDEVGNNVKWYLWDDNQELIGVYDWLISTIPAEQADEIFSDDKSLHMLIPKHVHSPCWAAAIATKGKVNSAVQGVFGDEQVSWFARQNSRPSRGLENDDHIDDIWNIHFSVEFTEKNIGQPVAVIEAMAFDWLQQTLQENEMLDEELHHVEGYCHFWRYARPSEEYNRHVEQHGSSIIFEAEKQLSIIGDWAKGGRVEGAILSALECYDSLSETLMYEKDQQSVNAMPEKT